MKRKVCRFKRLFIPCRANNYRASLLHLPVLAAVIFVFLAIQTAISLITLTQPLVLGYSSQITREEIINLTNQERVKLGLDGLKENSLLDQAAARKAADMFAFDYWAHTSPTGKEPWDFFDEAGYDYFYAGENLARDFQDAESVVVAWLASPTHKENLISDRYQEIGVAVVDGELRGLKTTLVVQLFGLPVTAPVSPPSLSDQAVSWSGGSLLGEKLVLSQSENDLGRAEALFSKPISPLLITKTSAVTILVLFLVVLLLDHMIAKKKGVTRLTGDNLAHFSFLLIVLLIIFFSNSGVIIESISNL